MEKKHRLEKDCYKGRVRATFTVCVRGRARLFDHLQASEKIIEILTQICESYQLKNWLYVLMPDHMHFIIEGKEDNCDLLKAVNMFKQKSGYWLKGFEEGLYGWQGNYYDFIHRKDEDLIKQLIYVATNPVRNGLCEKWEDYPHLGSTQLDVKKEIPSTAEIKTLQNIE